MGKEVTTLASTNNETLNFHQPRNIEGRFPAIECVLRKPEEAFASVCLSPAVVIEAMQALAKLNGDQPVTLDFYRPAEGKPINFIGLRTQTTELKIDGAMMPMSAD